MKVKNLTFADRYTEKLVLAAAVVYLLAVAWFFLFSRPYRVEVAGRMLGPDEADQYVAAQAARLKEALRGPAPEALRTATLPPYADLFKARLSAPITPPAEMEGVPPDALAYAPWAGNRAKLPEIDEGPEQRDPFVTPTPPTPQPLVARAEMGQLAMAAIDEGAREALIDRLGQAADAAPFDAQWVTVRSALDLASFREALLEPAADDEARPLPRLWLDSIVVLDVQVERRRVKPDGTYGPPQLAPPMPGRASLRAALMQDQLSDEQATRLLGQARAVQQQLLTPSFYPLAVGHSELQEMEGPQPRGRPGDGQPPEARPPEAYSPEQGGGYQPYEGGYQEGGGADRARARQLRRQLNELHADAEAILRRLEGVRGAQRDRLVQRARFLRREISRIESQMEQLDLNVPEGPDLSDLSAGGEGAEDAAGDGGPAEPTTDQRMLDRAQPWGGSIFAQDSLALWTTDLSVEPGARYEYRARVVISNPLYQRTQAPESQQQLAETFALTGPWSQWSDPVELPRQRYFYIVGGSRELGYVEVECWRFFRGLWRAATFQVRPGDPIGRPSGAYRLLERVQEEDPPGSVDFAQDAFTVDVDYNYPLAEQQFGGVSIETIRLLYADEKRLKERLRHDDRRRREQRAADLGLTLTSQ